MPAIQQRSPILVVLLSFFTLGVYFVYWVYRVNQEAAVLANDRYSRPLRSVLALTLGAVLIIPPYVTLWRTAERVGWATRAYSGFFANVFFSLLMPLLYPLWVQGKLNRKIGQWERQQQQIALTQSVQSRVVNVQSDLTDPTFPRAMGPARIRTVPSNRHFSARRHAAGAVPRWIIPSFEIPVE